MTTLRYIRRAWRWLRGDWWYVGTARCGEYGYIYQFTWTSEKRIIIKGTQQEALARCRELNKE